MSVSDKRQEDMAARADEAIDYSEIPELDDAFWQRAALTQPDPTEHVTLRVKRSVVEAYKKPGKGYTARMSAVLESYARSVLKQR